MERALMRGLYCFGTSKPENVWTASLPSDNMIRPLPEEAVLMVPPV